MFVKKCSSSFVLETFPENLASLVSEKIRESKRMCAHPPLTFFPRMLRDAQNTKRKEESREN